MQREYAAQSDNSLHAVGSYSPTHVHACTYVEAGID